MQKMLSQPDQPQTLDDEEVAAQSHESAQDVALQELPSVPTDAAGSSFENSALTPELDSFDYKPIPVWAPVSCVVGICSAVTFATVYGVVVPLLGLFFAWRGLRLVQSSGGAYGGRKLLTTGATLCLLCLVGGPAWHSYVYATEIPDGFERLSFQALSKMTPTNEDGKLRIADEARALDGKRLFIKGYMYPTGQKDDIQSFVLCKDTGECCFGGTPALTDMVLVQFVNDVRAHHRELQLVNVAGTFRARQRVVNGQLMAIYTLEAEYFK